MIDSGVSTLLSESADDEFEAICCLALDWRRTARATAWNAITSHAKTSRFLINDEEVPSEESDSSSRDTRDDDEGRRCETRRAGLDDSRSIVNLCEACLLFQISLSLQKPADR